MGGVPADGLPDGVLETIEMTQHNPTLSGNFSILQLVLMFPNEKSPPG